MKQTFTSLLFLLMLIPGFSQVSSEVAENVRPNPWEIGGTLSAASFAGDLVAPDASSLRATSFSIGAFGRLAMSKQFSLRTSFKYGRLTADDTDFLRLRDRGYSFTKNFAELTFSTEWEPFGNNPFQEDGTFKRALSPYLFLGLGGAFGSPDTNFGRQSTDTNPNIQEDLDNQRNSHFILPFGLGVKAYLSPEATVGLEVGWRPVFNDYLDGVSASGNPDANDWYGVLALSFGYRLGIENQ